MEALIIMNLHFNTCKEVFPNLLFNLQIAVSPAQCLRWHIKITEEPIEPTSFQKVSHLCMGKNQEVPQGFWGGNTVIAQNTTKIRCYPL